VVRWLGRALGVVVVAFLGLVVAYRFVDPPVTPLMLRNAFAYGVTKQWRDLDRVAPALVRAVVAAEDAQFLAHHGVDWEAIRRARDYNARHGDEPRRGGSTITMQCARNVFLWQGKSYARKSLEVGIAYLIEAVWGKRRILEIYLNVIEWGPGVYGVEAAARRSFGLSAAELDARQAALLAAVLPNPLRWSAGAPTRYLASRAAIIARRATHVHVEPLLAR
jgi:monofunctional biosynthetic peptidoglycan transglycosylase